MKLGKSVRRILWFLLAVAVIAAVVLAGSWFVRRQVQADSGSQSGEVVTAFMGDLSTTASSSGQLILSRQVQLSLETPGRVEKVGAHVGDSVKQGEVLIELEDTALQWAVRSAQQDLAIQEANLAALAKEPEPEHVAAAKASVASAQAQLDDLLAGPSKEDLAQAQAAVAGAQAQLDDLLAGPSKEELASAKASVASAQANLAVAKARYDAIEDQLTIARQELDYAKVQLDDAKYFYDALANDWQHKDYAPFSPEAETLKTAQANYDAALGRYNLKKASINDNAYRATQAEVAQAEARLAALTNGQAAQVASARAQLAQAQAYLATLTEPKTAQIASARQRLAEAEANLSVLVDGPTNDKLAAAKAQVEQAKIALQDAQDRLAKAVLTAPFDGVVTDVYVALGEYASGPAVELVDANSVEVVLDVDEVDIGAVEVGQPVRVTLEAWPDHQLDGHVSSIAPQADNTADIVTYEVHVAIEATDLPVRTGMTANADLVTASLENVLLVPNRAIIADRNTGKYYVDRVQGQEMSRVEVQIGVRDRTYTQILSGLNEGDKLVIAADRGLDLMSGPPRGFR